MIVRPLNLIFSIPLLFCIGCSDPKDRHKEIHKEILETTFYTALELYDLESFETAAALFNSLAEDGYPEAQYNLGLMHRNGQGFPQDYKIPNLCDSALYKLAGNAVSVPVVELIVQKLENII